MALTANAFKQETDRFAEAGFNDYITKPFTEAGLYEHMNFMAAEQGFELSKRTNYYSIEKSMELFGTSKRGAIIYVFL